MTERDPLVGFASRLPGVVLRCGLASGEDLVQACERLRIEGDVEDPKGRVQVSGGARADDRGRHGGLVEQPCESEVARVESELGREVLVLLECTAVRFERLGGSARQ